MCASSKHTRWKWTLKMLPEGSRANSEANVPYDVRTQSYSARFSSFRSFPLMGRLKGNN